MPGAIALAGLILAALNLRTAVGALSPVLDRIAADIEVSPLLISALGATPPLAFALSGLVAPTVARRAGLEATLVGSLMLIMVGHLGRASTPSGALLVVASVVTLVGVGSATVLMPPLVKRYFENRVGAVTAVYATAMAIGAAVPPAVAIPLADVAGWRVSLGLWAIVALVAVPPWLRVIQGHRRELARRRDAATTDSIEIAAMSTAGVRVARSSTAWAIAVIFGVAGMAAYACFGWLPQLLVDTAGVDEAASGALLALFAIMGLPASILVPLLASRMRSVAPLVLAGVAFALAGGIGLLLAPAAAPWLWVAFLGLGPLMFPLSMYLMSARARTPTTAVALSGFVNRVGYLIAATGPFLVGVLRDASGGWTVPLLFLSAVSLAALPAAVVLARGRMVDDDAR